MPKVHVNDIGIYYEVSGNGQPLLLIGGLGYGLWMWHAMIPLFAEHFQVISYDNRGSGQTDMPPGPYNVQVMADDAAGLLDVLEIKSAVVMGHSMGGFIAQQLALSRPDLVSKLVLSATNFGGPNHIPVTQEAIAVMMDRSGDPVDIVRRGIAVACAPGFSERHPELVNDLVAYRMTNPVPPPQYQAQMAVGLGLLSPEAAFQNRLKTVHAPTLILFGEHDKVVPPANAELLKKELPNSRVVILTGAGHMFPIEAPQAAAEAVAAFAKES